MGTPPYISCMRIRMNNRYESWDDDICFRR
jgi:hypothetical protein